MSKNITHKALTDPSFRAALLKDPKAAIEKAAGIKIPAGLSVKVLEDSASVIHLVLPAPLVGAKGPLSEADLAQVSGGAIVKSQRFECGDNTNGPARCFP